MYQRFAVRNLTWIGFNRLWLKHRPPVRFLPKIIFPYRLEKNYSIIVSSSPFAHWPNFGFLRTCHPFAETDSAFHVNCLYPSSPSESIRTSIVARPRSMYRFSHVRSHHIITRQDQRYYLTFRRRRCLMLCAVVQFVWGPNPTASAHQEPPCRVIYSQ